MTTRKFFSGMSLLAIAGLWTACSNDEPVPAVQSNDRAISFRVQESVPALRATGTTVDYVNAFVVNALGDSTGSQYYQPASKLTMNGAIVHRLEAVISGVSAFDYSPKAFYYSEDTVVGFSAYSPISPNITAPGLKGNASNTITYTVLPPDEAKGETRQEDLLVAHVRQTDLTGTTPVVLNFKHALSRVYVTASNRSSEPVIIDSLKLVNLYSTGTLDIDSYGWTDAPALASPYPPVVDINRGYNSISSSSSASKYKILWDYSSGNQDKTYRYVLPESGVAVPADTTTTTPVKRVYVVSKEQGMLVLPQTAHSSQSGFTTGDFYLEIGYKHSNITDVLKIGFDDLYGAQSNTKGLTFEFGRQYALNIDFGKNAITFTVTVEDWDTTIPVPTP